MASIDTKPHQKINRFYEFTNTIADVTKKILKTFEGMSTSDILGFTLEDLLMSIELQRDVDLRNALQQSVGEISRYTVKDNGVLISLAQVRRERQMKQFVSPHNPNTHVPIVNESASIVTPIK